MHQQTRIILIKRHINNILVVTEYALHCISVSYSPSFLHSVSVCHCIGAMIAHLTHSEHLRASHANPSLGWCEFFGIAQ